MRRRYDEKGYLTRNSLLREMRDVLYREHPDIERGDLLINLATPWREVRFPTGLIAKCAFVILRAPGFREAKRTVTQEPHRRWSMY
jgi:hypothetical protein